jgi:hypothetical protein
MSISSSLAPTLERAIAAWSFTGSTSGKTVRKNVIGELRLTEEVNGPYERPDEVLVVTSPEDHSGVSSEE